MEPEAGAARFGLYILVGQTPVPCDDMREFVRWFEGNNRGVFLDQVGEHTVSTIFLGRDRRIFGEGPPILFETMVFCEHKPECDLDNKMARYSDWLSAEAGHRAMVADLVAQTGATDPL